ncbi:Distal membrane-arm assembly complex protein [Dirofilaria immitis]
MEYAMCLKNEMNAADLVAVRNDQCSGDASIESVELLRGINTIQNYVTDYIQHRVHLHDSYCPRLPEIPVSDDYRFELIRTVALIFEKKHAQELTNMVTALCLNGRFTFQRYVEVVECFVQNDDDEPDEQLSYGRLVALIAFAGLVAIKLCDMKMFPEISMIASYTSKFLHKRIALTWPQNKRSWESFFDRAKIIIDKSTVEENKRVNLKSECSWWLSIRTCGMNNIQYIFGRPVIRKCIECQKRTFIHRWSKFIRWQELVAEEVEEKKVEKSIKNYIKLGDDAYLSPERIEDVLPKKQREDVPNDIEFNTFYTQLRYVDHSLDNLRRFKRYEHFQHLQYDQRFIPERLLFLGPDLAAAHFLVHRGAAVKFVADNVWIKKDDKGNYTLPGRKIPGLYIEAIDASDTELMFEGLENLIDLSHLRLLRLAGCCYADDWMMSRIGALFPESLEMLDLSDCNRITAKGLAGLRTLKKLRYLRLEGFGHVKDVAKTALLLEESIPNLRVFGINYENAMQSLQREMKLLANERIVTDAKGNAYAEDDDGRLFYVAGRINERPAVTDDDKPLMTSTIRRELPEIEIAEFERLDELSGGKLRHLLVGSPSGYSWTQEVETILSFEKKWKKKLGIPIDQKLLPRSERISQPDDSMKTSNNSLSDKQEDYILIEDRIKEKVNM